MPDAPTRVETFSANIKPPVTSIGALGLDKGQSVQQLAQFTADHDRSFYPMANLFAVCALGLHRQSLVHFRCGPAGTVSVPAGPSLRPIFDSFFFGFYPYDLQWRPGTAIVLLVALLLISQYRRFWKKSLAYAWLAGLVVMGILLRGGLFGLQSVESTQWGGLPLTLLLSVFGLTGAYPLGIVLALGRQSRLPAIKSICVIYIELIRGVPLISLLFMSGGGFPAFSPRGGFRLTASCGPRWPSSFLPQLILRKSFVVACRG